MGLYNTSKFDVIKLMAKDLDSKCLEHLGEKKRRKEINRKIEKSEKGQEIL